MVNDQHLELLRRIVRQAEEAGMDVGIGANVLRSILDGYDAAQADAVRLRGMIAAYNRAQIGSDEEDRALRVIEGESSDAPNATRSQALLALPGAVAEMMAHPRSDFQGPAVPRVMELLRALDEVKP